MICSKLATAGNGLFDQLDIVAAQQASIYLSGSYRAVRLGDGGSLGDVDLVYVPVPEPSTIVLLAIGLAIGLGRFRIGRGTFTL